MIGIAFLHSAPENSKVASSTKRRAAFVDPEEDPCDVSRPRMTNVSQKVSD